MENKPQYFADAHIHTTAVKQLQQKGLNIIRCEDVELSEAADSALLEYAVQNKRVLMTCDSDFVHIHFQWMAIEKPHAGIIYMSQKHACKHIREIIRIVTFWHDLCLTSEDLTNQLWLGEDTY